MQLAVVVAMGATHALPLTTQAAGFFMPLITSMTLLKTPAAVTSAPAPGPCTTRGRGVYHFVSNATMLSANCVDAKGWSLGYRPSFTAAEPAAMSMAPTNRRTSPAASASAIKESISSSYAFSSSTKASPSATPSAGLQFARAAGTRDFTGTSSSSSFRPSSRARMVTFRWTSVPLRSSRGSGSVKPLFLASATTSENLTPGFQVLKM
mmetsp:Transcript_1070/g.3840  ORF Transcript_1070/g.3840 Transcript_1070/m.3840 type:complete len:208 (-) Transcript_1070:863-1486(-)